MRRHRSLLPDHRAVLVALLLAGGLLLLPAASFAAAASADELLLLAVFVNGRDTKTIGEFTGRGGELSATAGELRALGFQAGSREDGDIIALHSVPGLSYRHDPRRQEIHIEVPVEALALTRIGAADSRNLAEIPFSQGTGALLNYDLTATAVDGTLFGSGLWEARGFSAYGVVTTSLLTTADSGGVSLRRLFSTYSYANPDTLTRSSVGDIVSAAMPWTRSVRLGGAQYATDFALRPDLITFPLPNVGGQAAVPSTVDVLVNGVQQLRRNIDPGPFEIQQLPVVTGAGNVTVLVTDVTGQQSSQTLPFYASSALLAPRLSSLSVDVGAVRRNFATANDHYGRAAGAATLRYGVTPKFTWEAHGEATTGFASFGTGGVVALKNFAIASFAGSVSTSAGNVGTAFFGSVERATPAYRLGVSALIADDKFRDLAAVNGDPFPRKVLQANAGLNMGNFGSLGAAFTHVERPVKVAGTTESQRISTVSATYSRPLSEHAYVYATGLHGFGKDGTSALLIGFAARLGESVSATAGGEVGEQGASANASVSRSATDIGDLGWRLYGRSGQSERLLGGVEYKSPFAFVSGAVDAAPKTVAVRVGATGAVAFLRGRILPSNRIQDSFALVDTGGIAGVKILRENRPVGETDSRGQLLIPDLRSFEANKITIDPTGLPLDADLASSSMFVRPRDRSGVLARFDIKQQHSALLKLTTPQGAPLAVGSFGVLQSSGAKIPVGYDGLAYVVGLEPHNILAVTLPDTRRCNVSFDFKPAPGTVPELGPLICSDAAVTP